MSAGAEPLFDTSSSANSIFPSKLAFGLSLQSSIPKNLLLQLNPADYNEKEPSPTADPLSITASILAVITAAVKSTKSLHETIVRFKGRDKTLLRLQNEIHDLVSILDSLKQVIDGETSMSALLRGPIERCGQICGEFEHSMESFNRKLKTGFRDWTKMEFMRGDINEFIDTISGYKSTISVGLGTITMQTVKVSQNALQEYNEMIQDTAYNLEVQLCRVDEKMARLTTDNTNILNPSIDLKDERDVTKQCLRICEDAKSYIESLTNQESSLLHEGPQSGTDNCQSSFEAQALTREALDENRDSFAATIGQLRNRLESLVIKNDPSDESERSRLLDDINTSRKCLEVCKMATEVSTQKIYRVGEVIADGDSDQVVVNTLADLFDVKKAISKDNSAQLVGSMTEEALHHLTEKRYGSRFGALTRESDADDAAGPGLHPASETRKGKLSFTSLKGYDEQLSGRRSRQTPLPNEVRKRSMRDEGEQDLGQ